MRNEIEEAILHLEEIRVRRARGLRVHYWYEGISDIESIPADATPDCVTRPLDIAWNVYSGTETDDGWHYSVRRVREVPMSAARGLPIKGTRFFADSFIVKDEREKTGFLCSADFIHGTFDGRRFKCVNNHGGIIRDIAMDRIVPIALGMQCFFEYAWTAEFLNSNGGASLVLPISQRMLAELLQLRDIPPGKTKRDRVIHTVSAYQRADGTAVDPHYRGHIEHLFEGVQMRISPPVNDILKARGAVAERLKNELPSQ